jgi:hypothetical protein
MLEKMSKSLAAPVLALGLLAIGGATAQAQNYPIADRVAQKLIEKYQNESCQQLQAERSQPRTGMREEEMQRVVNFMRNDPQLRQHFINMVAGPIANKMFDCDLIP